MCPLMPQLNAAWLLWGKNHIGRAQRSEMRPIFGDATAFRRVLTIRGRAAAVLGMLAIANETADAISVAMAATLPADGFRQSMRHLAFKGFLRLRLRTVTWCRFVIGHV